MLHKIVGVLEQNIALKELSIASAQLIFAGQTVVERTHIKTIFILLITLFKGN